MDIEKLIKRLYCSQTHSCPIGNEYPSCSACLKTLGEDIVTAFSTLQAENEKLRAELEQVKVERDAAVEDVAAIIGDVEEIRRGYDVDNADADGAFAELCETYCANKGRSCYAECEKYHCKNFKWRGPQKEN